MKQVTWGIIGCGNIANTFAQGLEKSQTGKLVAVASRSIERGNSFANTYNVNTVYDDYEALVNDKDIDAIYVATPHIFHFEHALLCLINHKHVLVEKPLAINAKQSRALFTLADKNHCFIMEGLWTRFLPAIEKLIHLLSEKIIGDVHTVKADFCIKRDSDDNHRLKNKDLAGGALLDLGIYPINFADIVFQSQPTRIQSSACIGTTDVDDRSFYLLEYPQNQRAILSSSITHEAPVDAYIYGSKGYIHVPHFLGAQTIHIYKNNQEINTVNLPFNEDENFLFEISHVNNCILTNQIQSNIMPHSKTLEILKTMDTLRAQWGLKYKTE